MKSYIGQLMAIGLLVLLATGLIIGAINLLLLPDVTVTDYFLVVILGLATGYFLSIAYSIATED